MKNTNQEMLPLLSQKNTSNTSSTPCKPDFQSLLANPLVKQPLPPGFSITSEAQHLARIWDQSQHLQLYTFEAFVHAGGSGMVFRVVSPESRNPQALKIVRAKILTTPTPPPTSSLPTALSPVSQEELLALKILSHSNLVHLEDAIATKSGVIAIITSYVDDPKPIDLYLTETLQKRPRDYTPFSPERIDLACSFLWERCVEIASALHHMHETGILHFDIKPANILISKQQTATLTDLGACVHMRHIRNQDKIRVQFTWTYAHPHLTSIIHKPRGITGGGLKASAEVDTKRDLSRFDLFSFGRTIQECLAILVDEFGDRCYSSYRFRYLWMIACLLLDGQNAPSQGRTLERDGQRFVNDAALGYPVALFKIESLQSTGDLVEKLSRMHGNHPWHEEIPELNPWQPEVVNTGPCGFAPFTKRLRQLFDHPAVSRLKFEAQLGWVKEVYPGATHNRWSHSIGVLAATCSYLNALLADPEVPTYRILATRESIVHTIVAACIHDIGQTAFAHDFEAASPFLYDHERAIERLLDEAYWGDNTLAKRIKSDWPEIDLERVLAILGIHRGRRQAMVPIDGIASDIVNGPIDADKYDYIVRDAAACGVAYGKGVDRERFLQALTANVSETPQGPRLALAYRAKSNAAIQSLLLTRYQMYEAVYWHHSFRCIQAMFSFAVAATFGSLGNRGQFISRDVRVASSTVDLFFYNWVVCQKSLGECGQILGGRNLPADALEIVPPHISAERALDFVWRFASNSIRSLLDRLARRDLFKRIFELRVSDLGDAGDYTALAATFEPAGRLEISSKIQEYLFSSIFKQQSERGPRETVGEHEARTRLQELRGYNLPMVVADFPIRGVPDERNFPTEIGDPARKYIPEAARKTRAHSSAFHTVKRLQTQMACVRVFVSPELHVLVARYLDPEEIRACVESAIPRLVTRH